MFSKFDCSRLDNKDLVERWEARNRAGSFVQTRHLSNIFSTAYGLETIVLFKRETNAKETSKEIMPTEIFFLYEVLHADKTKGYISHHVL
jgi:hypothetical protein